MITVKVQGLSQLASNLDDLSRRISATIKREALKHGGELMREQMARNAPNDPGKPDIRDMMVISNARGEDSQVTAVKVGPSKEGFYGSFIEFGTSHMPARPFVRPAFDHNAHEALVRIKEDIWLSLVARGAFTSTSTPTVVSSPGGSGLL